MHTAGGAVLPALPLPVKLLPWSRTTGEPRLKKSAPPLAEPDAVQLVNVLRRRVTCVRQRGGACTCRSGRWGIWSARSIIGPGAVQSVRALYLGRHFARKQRSGLW